MHSNPSFAAFWRYGYCTSYTVRTIPLCGPIKLEPKSESCIAGEAEGAMNRGRIGISMFGVYLTILLIGMSWSCANAQVKLVKPVSGGTIVINKSGSYFLGSNIAFGTAGAAAIRIAAGINNVTINLNGFTIVGVGSGSTIVGINAPTNSGITIFNGTVTKIPGKGIVLGPNSSIAAVQLIGNLGDALTCSTGCLVTGNVINGNGGTGLVFSDATSGYQNNVISGNGATVTGGTNMGHNVCNGSTTCP
jgi:hypothetical protein